MGSNYLEHYHPPRWMQEGLACRPNRVVEQQQSRCTIVVVGCVCSLREEGGHDVDQGPSR